ncbi:histidine kinase [Desulfosporosinus acidiphilus SJ4]|uniref:Histidine kinase n=1 Tax=Desulfosporosinus acidiphilus (strain DSM 22704 / JCM 16185 / SJ4) TaxID=646529 RepID=I4DC46_DESAJ|nr:PocR ligand-binding domain-containing protein [Desulfosporosinus acidiphilus]AFM43370.1 histidine kinase [Desulfosporosinus acidiphilus SJ4]
MDHKPKSLFQLIEEDKLVRIIETFTKATDITIDINDAMGFPVVQHDYFYGFCRSIRSTEAGLNRCIDSNAQLGFKSIEQGNSCIGKCHAGVMLMSVPIMVDDQFYGSITCGQMHLKKPTMQEIEEMLKATADLGLNQADLEQTFQKIQVISMDKCQAAGGLIQFVVSYIVELIYRAKMQEELSREKIKAAEDARIILELEHTLHKAELRNLQAQIKPHFLFNTLNTIISLITLSKNTEGLNTLFALSNLIRHNFDHPGELVSLREELHYVESYLLIQKTRFGNRLELLIEVPEELQNTQIPFLSLQPLVENACIHGLEPKEGVGHLWIKGKEVDDHVELSVIDNGVGMPSHYAALDFNADQSSIAGIGLRNVHKRLQLQFGKEFGVKLLPKQGLTTVSILIPQSKMQG